MQSSFLRFLPLVVAGLLGVQCADSLSDDCTKTLTCGDEPAVILDEEDCTWKYADGGIWTGSPQRTNEGWVWPDGTKTLEQTMTCRAKAPSDAGACGGCDAPLVCNTNSKQCVACVADGDCEIGKVCDEEQNICVECFVDIDCPNSQLCAANPGDSRLNECVECLANTDCEANEVCNEESHECTFQCTGIASDPCGGDKPVCNTDRGVCVACTANEHCTGNPNGTECNTVTNQCVQCVTQAPCNLRGGFCDESANVCVECFRNDHCTDPGLPQCNIDTNKCIACSNDRECTQADASRCNLATQTCVPCTNDGQCEGNNAFCQEGVCVACRDGNDCPPTTPLCEPTTDTCVECIETANCADPNRARCDQSTHACASCTSDDDCADKGFGSQCESGLCVQCGSNADCNGDVASSRCNVGAGAGTCGPCQNDTDCDAFPGQRSCLPGSRCVECDASTDCASNTNGETVCKLTAGGGSEPVNTCVECVVNGDCTDPAASRCLNNQCVPCRPANDVEDCHSVTAPGSATPLNVCDAGTCVQCTGTERGACNQNVCDSIAKTCTPFPAGSAGPCATCVSDAHCSTDGSEFCAPQIVSGSNLGFFCFPAAASQGAACPGRVHVIPATSTTIDSSASRSLCFLRSTTCPARSDFGSACQVNQDCGAASLDDGFCDANTGGTLQCTIPCVTLNDCPGTADCLDTGRCEL